jgi:hypothetical protein
MPTVNPRVNVTLPPSLDLLVGRMAELQRVSKSQVLRELLEAAEPALRRAVALMEAAAGANAAVRDRLAHSLEAAMSEAEESLSRVMSAADTASQDLVTLAEQVKTRRPRRTGGSQGAGAVATSRRAAVRKTPA